MSIVPSVRSQKAVPKYAVALPLAIVVFGFVLLTRVPGPLYSGMQLTNELFYDIFYKLRLIDDRTNGPVVIVTADQASLTEVNDDRKRGWPWPRSMWAHIAKYASESGAKAIVFDITFSERSKYQKSSGDDETFATLMSELRTPVIFGSMVNPDGSYVEFVPKIPNPTLGVVNVDAEDIVQYVPYIHNRDSLAAAVAKAIGSMPEGMKTPFLLHYYGPTENKNGQNTYKYISAASVLQEAIPLPGLSKPTGVTPSLFKDRIVLLGATAQGTYDSKSTPLSSNFPGVEVQATAIENLLERKKVVPISLKWQTIIALLCAFVATFGVIYPRNAVFKLTAPTLLVVVLIGAGAVLFQRADIRWLPPAESLLVLFGATPIAFAYTYFVEDKQSRFMLKALSKVVSPTVAKQLAENPDRLERNTKPRQLTVLFSDLANFTSLSESMKEDNDNLVAILDDYLGDMSDEVISRNGTLDKYIGDSIMCFWNAPLEQRDHAVRACQAALAMQALKKEYTIPAKKPGEPEMHVYTRIGINTAEANFGFVGSSHLMNYTVMGDGVNLASRLEGANKIYGTRILISQNTASLVDKKFHLRKLDRLQVKGKGTSIDVFELLAEKGPVRPDFVDRVEQYESALAEYQKQNWDVAERKLLDLRNGLSETSYDRASEALLKRISILRTVTLPKDWDGAYEAEGK